MSGSPHKRGHRSVIPGARTAGAPTDKQFRRATRRTMRRMLSAQTRHLRAAWRINADANRPSSSKRGYDRRWRKTREAVLAEQPECAICGKAAATEVDHVIPHRGNAALFRERDNLQGLCKACHSAKTLLGQ